MSRARCIPRLPRGGRPGLGLALALALALAAHASVARAEARGEVLYQFCGQCHGEDGSGDPLAGAPAIAGMAEWYVAAQLEKFKSGARGAHPDDVEGLRMRPMSRTLRDAADVAAVAAYVAGLRAARAEPLVEGGDVERGKALYTPCIACHGMNAEGNQALNGPALRGTSDWYLLRQLEKFKAGVRGSNPADTTGMLMRPMALILPDGQAMKDVVAYLATLSP